MDSKPSIGSDSEPSPAGAAPTTPPIDWEPLRKKVMTSVAQHLTLDLFEPGKEPELSAAIHHHLQSVLHAEKATVAPAVTDKWVEDMISSLSQNRITPAAAKSPAKEITWTVETLRAHVAPYIAGHLGNALFEPGREAQLSEAVYMLVQEKIRQDEITVDEVLRNNLMKALSEAMQIPMPSALSGATPSPVKNTTPPPPPAPPPEPKPAPGAPVRKIETRPIKKDDLPLQTLTPDLRRLILLEIASKLDPGILGAGKPAAARTHVGFLIAAAIKEMRVQLTPEQTDEILGTILSGEGVEFQL